jgi:hypothetical protein
MRREYISLHRLVSKTDVSSETFLYRSLSTTQSEIRLLCFDRSPRTDPNIVSCTIIHFCTTDCPPYDALSYAWGDTALSHEIMVDDQVMLVTESLQSALLRLHHDPSIDFLWVDALCINQADDREKSQQVQRMRSIYKAAKVVYAWLGPGTLKSELFMVDLSKIGRSVLDYIILESSSGDTSNSRLPSRSGRALKKFIYPKDGGRSLLLGALQYLSHLELSFGNVRDLLRNNTMTKLLSSSLWERVWILQEFCAAHELVLVWGTANLAFKHFSAVWALLYNALRLPQEFGKNIDWGNLQDQLERTKPMVLQHIVTKHRPLLGQLTVTHMLQATDPRDKLFALLGISTDAQDLKIRADYSKSLREVCVQLSSSLLARDGLSSLSVVTLPWYPSPNPSWVPDWSRWRSITPIQNQVEARDGQRWFAAAGARPAKFSVSDQAVLSITGRIFGVVQDVGSTGEIYHFGRTQHRCKAAKSFWKDIHRYQGQTTYLSPTNITEDLAFRLPILFSDHPPPHNHHPNLERIDHLQISYQALRTFIAECGDQEILPKPPKEAALYLNEMAPGLFPFKTSDRVGMGPKATRRDDLACIFHGAPAPFIIRRRGNGRYIFVGEAFVDGIMHGEAMGMGLKTETFELD